MKNKIKLVAEAPPAHAGRQHVARILGRKGAGFRRRQLGSPSGRRGEVVGVVVTEPGLYELREICDDGSSWDCYALVLIDCDNGKLRRYGVDLKPALRLAKMLQAGKKLDDVVWGDCGGGWAFVADEPRPEPIAAEQLKPENLFKFKC